MQKFRLSQFDFLLLRKTKMVPVFHAASFGLPHDTSMIRMHAACGSKPKNRWMDPDLSEADSEASSLSLVGRHVHNLERRLAHLEHIIFALAERLGQLEEKCRVAESHFARTEQLAREARTLGRLELDQLAHRLQACESTLDLATLD